MARLVAILILAAVVAPADAARAQAPEPAPTLTDRANSNLQAACRRADGPCPRPDVRRHERSATHRALAFQYRLASRVPLRDAPWVGTHNSANTASEDPTLSGLDHNQQVSMADQLRMDVRSLEIDLHFVRGEVMVCHGRGEEELHAGCTTERSLAERLPEVSAWLRAHPRQVILLYFEDDLGSGGHDPAAAVIEAELGDLVYRPAAPGCNQLPLELTRAAVRAAGKQVVIVSDCGRGAAWQGLVFAWDEHVEARPVGFDPRTCGPDFTPEQYASTIVRYFEDSTVVSATLYPTGASSLDDGLTPETTAAMVRCGVDLFGFDQLLPDDGRLDALVWSWAPHRTRCAVHRPNGHWRALPCRRKRPYACRDASGAWLVTSRAGRRRGGRAACRKAGARFVMPRTGAQNAALAMAATGSRPRPWLAYKPPGKRSRRGSIAIPRRR